MTNEILTREYAEFLEELKNRVASSRYKAARIIITEKYPALEFVQQVAAQLTR